MRGRSLAVIAALAVGSSAAQQPPPLTGQQMQQLQQLLGNLSQSGQNPWQLSGFDLVQNNDIAELKVYTGKIDEHLGHTDVLLNALAREESEADGRSSVWNAILSVIVAGLIGERLYAGSTRKED